MRCERKSPPAGRCDDSDLDYSPVLRLGRVAVMASAALNPLLCKPDIVYVLDRGHRLHFWALTMPVFNWGNAFVSFIEYTE